MKSTLPCIICHVCLWEYLEVIKTNRNPYEFIPTSQVDTIYCYCMQKMNVCPSGNIKHWVSFFFFRLFTFHMVSAHL